MHPFCCCDIGFVAETTPNFDSLFNSFISHHFRMIFLFRSSLFYKFCLLLLLLFLSHYQLIELTLLHMYYHNNWWYVFFHYVCICYKMIVKSLEKKEIKFYFFIEKHMGNITIIPIFYKQCKCVNFFFVYDSTKYYSHTQTILRLIISTNYLIISNFWLFLFPNLFHNFRSCEWLAHSIGIYNWFYNDKKKMFRQFHDIGR